MAPKLRVVQLLLVQLGAPTGTKETRNGAAPFTETSMGRSAVLAFMLRTTTEAVPALGAFTVNWT